MRRVLAWSLVVVALIGAALLALAFRPPFTPALKGSRAVAELARIRLGGVDQTVLIRGRDARKPILLFLHGGPGMPAMFLAHRFQRPLEEDFLVVHWDRRGAGKSYSPHLDPTRLRTSQELADAVALIGRLQQRYGERPVILVGHSYGSWLGAALAHERPDLVRAYVGVGQVACDRATELALQDAWLAGQAAANGDPDVLAKAKAGGEWDRESALFRYGAESTTLRSPWRLVLIGLAAPEYNGRDVVAVMQGVQFTHRAFAYDGPELPLWTSAVSFSTPVYLFHGRQDYVTPPQCVTRYFQAIRAPAKRLVWFERSGHFPFLDEPQQFRGELRRVAAETGR